VPLAQGLGSGGRDVLPCLRVCPKCFSDVPGDALADGPGPERSISAGRRDYSPIERDPAQGVRFREGGFAIFN